MLLAIDGGTEATGFAFGSVENRAPKGGVWAGKGCSDQVFDQTLGGSYTSVSSMIRVVKPTRVLFEAPLDIIDETHSKASAMALMQLTGAIRAACANAQVPLSLIAIADVRRTFVGTAYPKDPKETVMARNRELGWAYQDHNQADANALWFHGMTKYFPNWRWANAPQLFARRA